MNLGKDLPLSVAFGDKPPQEPDVWGALAALFIVLAASLYVLADRLR